MSKPPYTYTITRREGTDPYTRRPLYWVVLTRSDGLQVRSSDWRIDDGSAEAEAQARMTQLEQAGGYAPIALREAVKAMVPALTQSACREKGPVPADIRWRVLDLLRLWGDRATVDGIRKLAAEHRAWNAEARRYLAALQAELDLADAALAAIEAGLPGQADV